MKTRMKKYGAQGVPKRFELGQAPTSLDEIIPNVLFTGCGNAVTTSGQIR
jgi:hypothetical protein